MNISPDPFSRVFSVQEDALPIKTTFLVVMTKGLVSTVTRSSVCRARFIKLLSHRGPKTGKDDRYGSVWRHDLRGSTRLAKQSEDGSMMAVDPLSVPKIVVPDLRKFELKAFVSEKLDVKTEAPATVSEYLDTVTINKGSFK